jgi:teichuronic acid exporter
LSSLKQQGVKGFFWTFLDNSSSQLFTLVFSFVIARLLKPEDFGLLALFSIVLQIAQTLVTSGLATSLVRRGKISETDKNTVFWFSAGMGVLLYVLIYGLAPYIALFFEQDILIILIRLSALSLLWTPFGIVGGAILSLKLDFKKQLVSKLPAIIVSGVVGISMAFTGFGVYALIAQTLLSSIISNLALAYWVKFWPNFGFSVKHFYYHWRFGYKLTLAGILYVANTNFLSIVIGKVFSPADLGLYNRADNIKNLPVQNFYGAISRVAFPLLVRFKDDKKLLERNFYKIINVSLFVLGLVLSLISLNAYELILILLGSQWVEAAPMLALLCFNGFLFPMHALNVAILNVLGRSDLFLKLDIIKTVIGISGVLIFYRFGIYGLIYWAMIRSYIILALNAYTCQALGVSTVWQQYKASLVWVLLFLPGFLAALTQEFFLPINNIFLSVLAKSLIFMLITLLNFKFFYKGYLQSFHEILPEKLQNQKLVKRFVLFLK